MMYRFTKGNRKSKLWKVVRKMGFSRLKRGVVRIQTLFLLKKRSVGSSMIQFKKHSDDCFLLLHLGNIPVPEYVIDAINQIRLYSNNQIVFACNRSNQVFCKKIKDICDVVFLEDIPASAKHIEYAKKLAMEGFSLWTTERFFVVEELIDSLKLHNVVHLENDNLIYGDVHPVFHCISTGNKLVLTRHNNDQCIGGIVYIPSVEAISKYTEFLLKKCSGRYINDMDSLSDFAKNISVDYAPVVPREYALRNEFKSAEGKVWDGTYSINSYTGVNDMSVIFDAAALGQYIGGIPKYIEQGNSKGFINQNCLYDPSLFDIQWEKGEEGYAPYVYEENERYKVMNLHIHCKELYKYRSDNPEILKNV